MSVQNIAPPDAASRRPAAVYRLYDAEGTLLYIGSSYDPEKRCENHARKPWWSQVAKRTEEWHGSRSAAYTEEAKAIWEETPRHNVASTLAYAARRRAPGTAAECRERSKAAYLEWTAQRDAQPGIFDLLGAGLSWDAALQEIRRCREVYERVIRDAADVDQLYAGRAEQVVAVIESSIRGLAWPERRRKIEKLRVAAAKELRIEGADGVDVATVMAIVNAQVAQFAGLLADEATG